MSQLVAVESGLGVQLCLFDLSAAPRAPSPPALMSGFELRMQVCDARCECGVPWTFEVVRGRVRPEPECPRCGGRDVKLDGPPYWLEGTC